MSKYNHKKRKILYLKIKKELNLKTTSSEESLQKNIEKEDEKNE